MSCYFNSCSPRKADGSNTSGNVDWFSFQYGHVEVGSLSVVVRMLRDANDVKDHQISIVIYLSMVSVPYAYLYSYDPTKKTETIFI
jgi:hypothetical protein